MSTFNPSIPQANDRLAKSQQDLLKNNQQLDTSFGINHYTFSDPGANNGMHTQCQLVELANPVPVVGTDSLYCAVAGSPSLGELFYVRGGGGTPIQMTAGDIFPSTNDYTPQSGGGSVGADFTAGATFLPGGLLLQYGTVTADGLHLTVKYPRTFSSAPDILQLTLKGTQTSSSSRIALSVLSASSTTQFTYQLNVVATTSDYVNWLAIGSA